MLFTEMVLVFGEGGFGRKGDGDRKHWWGGKVHDMLEWRGGWLNISGVWWSMKMETPVGVPWTGTRS